MNQRINFRIDDDLALKFESTAKQQGLTKAKLLRKWIDEPRNQITLIATSPESKSRTFNFRVDQHANEKIITNSSRFRISHSDYLRLLISSQLKQTNNKLPSDKDIISFKDLWAQGQLSAIHNEFANKIDLLTTAELIRFAHANYELGEFQSCQDAISILEKRISYLETDNYLVAEICILKADISYFHRDVIKTNIYLNKALAIADRLKRRDLLGKIFAIQTKLKGAQEDVPGALASIEKAISYLDIINHPHELAEAYLRLAQIHTLSMNLELAQRSLQQAFDILEELPHEALLVKCKTESAIQLYLRSQYDGCCTELGNSLQVSKNIGSVKGQIDNYEDLGIVELFRNSYDNAYTFLKNSERLENQLNRNPLFSYSELFQNFLISKHNYQQGVTKMTQMVELQHKPWKQNLGQYFLYSLEYMYAPTSFGQKQGANKLLQLAEHGRHQLVRHAAEQTLRTKNLSAMR